MSEFQNFIVYEIEETGDSKKLEFPQEHIEDYLHPEKAFLIVRGDLKRIYFWKGNSANVRKRFIGSRIAGELQKKLKGDGFPHCKIVAVDQGDELEEFLNVFGLKSMEVTEILEDLHYIRDIERKKIEEAKLFERQEDIVKGSKLDEIKNLLDKDERILWIKNSTLELKKNWLKLLLKDKKLKERLKNLDKAKDIEIKNYEIRYLITNKRVFLNSFLNRLYDFSSIPENIFNLNGDIAILDLRGIRSFEIEESNESYDIWFNAELIKGGYDVLLFDNLSTEEFDNFMDIITTIKQFRVEIPKNLKLKYIRK